MTQITPKMNFFIQPKNYQSLGHAEMFFKEFIARSRHTFYILKLSVLVIHVFHGQELRLSQMFFYFYSGDFRGCKKFINETFFVWVKINIFVFRILLIGFFLIRSRKLRNFTIMKKLSRENFYIGIVKILQKFLKSCNTTVQSGLKIRK